MTSTLVHEGQGTPEPGLAKGFADGSPPARHAPHGRLAALGFLPAQAWLPGPHPLKGLREGVWFNMHCAETDPGWVRLPTAHAPRRGGQSNLGQIVPRRPHFLLVRVVRHSLFCDKLEPPHRKALLQGGEVAHPAALHCASGTDRRSARFLLRGLIRGQQLQGSTALIGTTL